MVNEVILDDLTLQVTNYKEEIVVNQTGEPLKKINIAFKVRGGEEYHDVTSHLYKKTFDVKVPQKGIQFRATIYNYSTSRTDFSNERCMADFQLSLLEVQ
ncbi:DUF3219 family protein [Alkalihalobacterium alkalinitrilicum]|uniref:DUF3219 family protein n=1 Tax=Alkalihalobacterium alkalinitrilicum TaxID=427920 RepID=UPI000995D0BC|nr:DUF3219 family protein [Alkalihalobacterium alkalinitrilicum]